MGDWQQFWDKEAKAHYYWNSKTNETTWDEPESLKKKEKQEDSTEKPIESVQPTKEMEEYFKSKEYYDWYMQHMNAQAQQSAAQTYMQFKQESKYQDLIANPIYDAASHVSYSKDIKHMSAYFDVEKYQRERALDRSQPKNQPKLSKKQIEQFKKRNKEKKVKKLLERMGADN
jgi:hypothetical protein